MSVSAVGTTNAVNEAFEAAFIRQQETAALNRQASQPSELQRSLDAQNTNNANAANQTVPNEAAARNTNPISLLATQYDIGSQIDQARQAAQQPAALR